ncbi:hypothetical protein [Wolbachia endosymbiont (group B) of Limnophora tigrina]|uniref:hypothetical protein n=1 Tax=Wolbachia endosymbiont (group B) of Limnophora tigrina TaxID=3139317 RepID=UPI0035B50580
MRDLYSKINAPYLIAGAFATLVLLASGTLAVAPYVAFLSPIAAFNVALPVALSLSILSILILALSCKMISNNKKIEVERNKFAQKKQELANVKQQLKSKVQELENKIALGEEAREAANKQEEQLNELTQEKQSLESEIEGLNKEIDQLKKQLTDAHQELNLAEQELTNIKQQLDDAIKELNNKDNQIRELEGKVRELNNRMTVVVDATSKHTEKLNNQLNRLTREKQGLDERLKELNKKVSQLECEKNNSLHYTEELCDENTKLNERVDSLMEELFQCKSESEENKLRLKSEYEDELRLRSEYKDKLNSELECKSREASSLKTQLAMLRGKVKKLEEEGESKNCTSSFVRDESILAEKRNLAKKLNQEKDKNKELESVLNDLNINYDNQRDKNFVLLKENEELKEELSSSKADKEELVNESIRAKNDHKEDVNKFEAKKREYVTKVVFTVLSIVKERVEEGFFNSAEQQYMQDTDRIQEGVDEFMQPIYGKLNIDNQQKFNYCPTMLEQLQDLLTAPCTQLADLGYTSRYSTPTNSYRTF